MGIEIYLPERVLKEVEKVSRRERICLLKRL